MGALDCLKQLRESLGDREQQYNKLMRVWFKMRMTKDELDREVLKFLTPAQLLLHDQWIKRLTKKCIDSVNGPPLSDVTYWKTYSNYDPRHFTPLDPLFYVVTERHECDTEPLPYMAQEKALLDQRMAQARFNYGAWETGLNGATSSVSEYLLIATNNFLKDIITAIICWRKGYKYKHGFIHGVGTPELNPWLRNRPKTEPFHGLELDPNQPGYLVPSQRPTLDDLERVAAMEAACDSQMNALPPISPHDLLITLKMYPNLVASNFVQTVNIERIYARLKHPSWDD